MTPHLRWPLLLALAVVGCKFQWSARTSGTGTSAPAHDEPTASAPTPEPPPAVVRNADTEQTEELLPTRAGRPAPKAWDGTYVMRPGAACTASPYRASGPADQTVWWPHFDGTPGLVCPATCDDPTPLVVANGVATFSYAWLDADPPRDPRRGFQLTFHRTTVSVPLIQTDGGAGVVRFDAMPARHWPHGGRDHTSDQVAINLGFVEANSAQDGRGRLGGVSLSVGHHDRYYLTEDAPNCVASLTRTDFIMPTAAPASDDDADDATTSSPSTHGADRAARAAQRRTQKCRATCRSDAGECRKSCRGAKCANDCNRTERSCTSSC
ncbi:MAG: hypothetical protein KF773_02785 [Deltaproteobacteria bacterium]|nr:hypothetical protein [Deltaproteobacteria bacterium]